MFRTEWGKLGVYFLQSMRWDKKYWHPSRPFNSRCCMTADFYTVFQEALVGWWKGKSSPAYEQRELCSGASSIHRFWEKKSSHSPTCVILFSSHVKAKTQSLSQQEKRAVNLKYANTFSRFQRGSWISKANRKSLILALFLPIIPCLQDYWQGLHKNTPFKYWCLDIKKAFCQKTKIIGQISIVWS